MSRSLWKPTVYTPMLQLRLQSTSDNLIFQNRASFISEQRVNHQMHMYNGQRWYHVRMKRERIGHRVGEFAPTRKRPIPKKKKRLKK